MIVSLMWQFLSIDIGILGQEISILGLCVVFVGGAVEGVVYLCDFGQRGGEEGLQDKWPLWCKADDICIHCWKSLKHLEQDFSDVRNQEINVRNNNVLLANRPSFPNPTFFHSVEYTIQ